jgi:drug/metabolite transporter (DMT)-like permease
VWGSGFFWIKIALRGFDPVQIVFVRLLLGCLTLTPIALSRGLRSPRGWRVWGHLLVAALVANAVPYVLFGMGEKHVNSNIAGVLNATTPLWTLLLGLLVEVDRSITWQKGAGFGLGFLGAVTIFSPWQSASGIASWSGVACLVAAASYGVSYVYMGRHLTGRGITPLMLSASQLAAGTLILAFALPIGGRSHPIWRADAILSLLMLGVIGTGLAYVLNYRIIEDEGAAIASTVTYLLPVVAIALGWLALRESAGPATLIGVGLVLAGVALTRQRPATLAESRR